MIARHRPSESYGRSFSFPVATRWYSAYQCLVNVIKNKEAITLVFNDDEFMEPYKGTKKKRPVPAQTTTMTKLSMTTRPKRTKKKTKKAQEAAEQAELDAKSAKTIAFTRVDDIVRDEDFWVKGGQVIKLLKPVIIKLGLMESDNCCISLVYWSFKDLLRNPIYRNPTFLVETAKAIRVVIQARWDKSHTDAMGIAYFLDQSKDPRGFVGKDRKKTKKQIRKVAERLNYDDDEVQAAFHQAGVFWNRKRDWSDSKRRKESRTAPLEWWGEKRDTYPILYRIARRVFTMPTSSASTERNWSSHSYIYSDRRCQLGLERLCKLMFVYCNRNGKEPVAKVVFDESTISGAAVSENRREEGKVMGVCYEEDLDTEEEDRDLASSSSEDDSGEDSDDEQGEEEEEEHVAAVEERLSHGIDYLLDYSLDYLETQL